MTRSTAYAVLPHPDVRDTQILRLLAAGQTYAQIGRIVGLGEDSVRVHLKRVAVKVNAGNNCQLIAIAFRNGWIE